MVIFPISCGILPLLGTILAFLVLSKSRLCGLSFRCVHFALTKILLAILWQSRVSCHSAVYILRQQRTFMSVGISSLGDCSNLSSFYSHLCRQKVVCHCEAVRLWQSQSFFSLLCAKGGGLPLGKTEGLRIV